MKRHKSTAEHDARSLADKARPLEAGPARVSAGGEPLPRQLLGLFGAEHRQRLEGARLHSGPQSEAATRRERSQAFASAGHIHFAAGAFDPRSRSGAGLLHHELAHVALGHEGLNRQPLPGTAHRSIVDLTNADFVAAVATGPAEGGYSREEIIAERARRVALGHDWLTEALTQTPARLLIVIPGGGVEAVHEADLRIMTGPLMPMLPARVMTPDQLRRNLNARGIGTVRISQLLASEVMPPVGGTRTVGGLAQNGARQSLPYVILDPVQVPPGLSDLNVPAVDVPGWGLAPSNAVPQNWRGPATQQGSPQLTSAQFAARQSGDISSRLLIAWQDGDPMVLGMDQFTVGGARSLTATGGYVVSIQGSGGVGTVLFAERMLRALAMGQQSHQLQVNPASGESRSSTGRERNAVVEFHQRIHQAAQRRGSPPQIEEYYFLNQAEMARVALAFGEPLLTPEIRAILQRVAAGDVAAAAELAPQMQRMAASMRSDAMLLDFDTRTWGGRFQQSFLRSVADPRTPEFYAAGRYGSSAVPRGGAYGAGLGFLLALPVDAAVRGATGRGYGDYWDRAPQTVATGAFGGALAGASNQAIVSSTSNALLNRGIGAGLQSTVALTGARAIPGGIGAAGAEILSMAVFEDREHSAREVTLRTGRAGGMGAVSTVAGSILGAAATGAVAGSVAPGVGNAIGFVAGLVTGVVVYVVLDQVVPQVDPTQ